MKKNASQEQRQAIKQVLDQKMQALTTEAIRTGGQVDAEQWNSVNRLKEIVAFQEQRTTPRPTRRAPIVLLFAITLAVVSGLLFARVPDTDVELEVSVSALSFRVPRTQSITNIMRLRSMGASGLQTVRLPPAGDSGERELTVAAPGMALQMAIDTGKGSPGTLDLDGINLAGSTKVQVSETDNAGGYGLNLQHKAVALQAHVFGTVAIGSSNAPQINPHFASPQTVEMKAGEDGVDLGLTPLLPVDDLFSDALQIDSLQLVRIDQSHEEETALYRRLSTIRSGTLYLSSLGGEARTLRNEEELRFATATGNIRTVCVKNGHLFLDFHGRVTGMTTGAGPNKRSLMPTWLDWLKARHGLSLLWGSTLYLFGLLLGLARWWREEK